MKKLFLITILALSFFAFQDVKAEETSSSTEDIIIDDTTTSTDDVVVEEKEPKKILSSGSIFNLIPRIVERNFNLNIDGSDITMNWMTNQFTTGEVKAIDQDGQIFSFDNHEEKLATYHTVKFQLPKGKYAMRALSVYKDIKYLYSKVLEFEVK